MTDPALADATAAVLPDALDLSHWVHATGAGYETRELLGKSAALLIDRNASSREFAMLHAAIEAGREARTEMRASLVAQLAPSDTLTTHSVADPRGGIRTRDLPLSQSVALSTELLGVRGA